MAAADPLNANPTILNPSDLPTRLVPRSGSPSAASAKHDVSSFILSSRSAPSAAIFSMEDFQASTTSDSDSDAEEIDEQEIFDLISTISDPEHPLSLGSLAVVSLPDIHISPPRSAGTPITTVTVLITPTITHCSLATVIGLGVRVRLEQALPPRFRVDVRIKPGSHSTAAEVTKQLADKERVAAALENSTLMGVIRKMLETCA